MTNYSLQKIIIKFTKDYLLVYSFNSGNIYYSRQHNPT